MTIENLHCSQVLLFGVFLTPSHAQRSPLRVDASDARHHGNEESHDDENRQHRHHGEYWQGSNRSNCQYDTTEYCVYSNTGQHLFNETFASDYVVEGKVHRMKSINSNAEKQTIVGVERYRTGHRQNLVAPMHKLLVFTEHGGDYDSWQNQSSSGDVKNSKHKFENSVLRHHFGSSEDVEDGRVSGDAEDGNDCTERNRNFRLVQPRTEKMFRWRVAVGC